MLESQSMLPGPTPGLSFQKGKPTQDPIRYKRNNEPHPFIAKQSRAITEMIRKREKRCFERTVVDE